MDPNRMFKFCLTGAFLLVSTQAHALVINAPDPMNDCNYDTTGAPSPWCGGNNATSQILTDIEAIMGTGLEELYKQDQGGGEFGSMADYYSTGFSNALTDPMDALITWTGSGDNYIDTTNPTYLLIKDGVGIYDDVNTNNMWELAEEITKPAWYLYDISAWDGMEDIDMQDFWPEQGAISHVAIYGTTSVPEPSQMLLFGTGLIGFAGSRLRRKKKQ